MTDLDDAIEEHMAFIVLSQGKPFSFADLLDFEVDGKRYKPSYGTIRNKFCQFKKQDKIVLYSKSNPAFYTLKEYNHGKLVTPNHTGVTISHNDPVYQMIKNLPMDKQSIHDIHLRFSVPNIYKIISVNANTSFPINKRSKDILIPSWNKNNAIVRIVIDKTDTISVTVGCSLEPIPLDYNGIIRFFTILARSEGLLQGLTVMVHGDKINPNLSIPQYGNWIITMWHFGRDGLLEYTGEKFSITVGKAQHILTRLYSKDYGSHTRIRDETQEYPNKTVFDAIEEKLN